MTTTLMKRSHENVNLEVPRKIQRKSSPRLGRRNVSSLQTYKIIFEFGPHQLNLFRYITKKSGILWKDAKEKCILKDGGKPTDGLLLICEDDEGTVNECLKVAGFDVYKYEKLLETDSVMNDERKSVCIFYFGEQFWKTMNKPRVQTIRDAIRKVSNTNVFIITTSDKEKDEAIECCKRFQLCPIDHVISPASDKTAFFEAFYIVLDKELQTFSSDLEIRTSTRQIHAIKSKLNSLFEKLRSRNTSIKSPLTKQCLEIIKASGKNGVIGYRLLGNELHVYENEHLRTETERRSEIENCIKNNFKGEVHLRPLNKVLKPQGTVRCGDYLRNDTLGIKGTIGMFGEISTLENPSIHTVALSSPHVISSGDIACSSTGERIGECFWPGSKANIHDVSIIKIDPSMINSLQRTYFNENITVEERPHGSLRYRDVFKYGATTGKTSGSIEQINDFQLFDRDVMAISSDDPENPFSTNGDSGAIVLTRIDGKLYGIGVIYGGSLDDRGANSSITKNESIAIFLKKAIDQFTTENNMTMEFDKM